MGRPIAKASDKPENALKNVEERCIQRLGSSISLKNSEKTSESLGRTRDELNQMEANSQIDAIRSKPKAYLNRLEQIEVFIG